MATLSAQGNLSEACPTPHAYKSDGKDPASVSALTVVTAAVGGSKDKSDLDSDRVPVGQPSWAHSRISR